MAIEENLLAMVKDLTENYFLNQVTVIVLLFLLGNIFLSIAEQEIKPMMRELLSFPLGLALFAVMGTAILITGIPFNSCTAALAPVLLIILLFIYKNRKDLKGKIRTGFCKKKADIKESAGIFIVLLTAIVSVSGIMSLNISNDSVYYYSSFPAMLVQSGGYTKSFDTYLTNVGQTSAVINCIPFLYGFDTTFGIQHFFNINFVLIFTYILYSEINKKLEEKKKALIMAVLGSLFLASSTPFIIVSKWVLSNVYFMDYIFLLFYMLKDHSDKKERFSPAAFILFALIAMLRQEGTVMVLLLIIAASSFKLSNKKLAFNFVLPVFLIETLYYVMLFLRLGVDPLYSFLDWKKAALVIGASLILGIYMLFIRGRYLRFISDNINIFLILAAAAGNLVIAVISGRYRTNLYAFYQNIRQGNGWGYFGIFLAVAVLIMAAEILLKRFKDISYTTAVLSSILMTAIIVAWARGGSLVVRTSDSGNRVLLQCVPFVVYLLVVTLSDADRAAKTSHWL